MAPENVASSSLGSCIAGWKVIPGMAISVIPAPWGGFAGLLLGRVASMVILRCSVFPGATETVTGVFRTGIYRRTDPRSVVMVTHSMLGRCAESSSGVMAIDVSGTARSNVIDTH